MLERILFVCIGNICRSPMAEGLLREIIKATHPSLMISSAGLAALINKPAASSVQSLLSERQIDISTHRARQLTEKMVLEADLILTMEKFQEKEIKRLYPYACGKVFLLGRWGNYEIPDPYGGKLSDYETALKLIEKGINDWRPKLNTI